MARIQKHNDIAMRRTFGLLMAALAGCISALAAAQVGKPAPAFTATDLDGHPVSLAALKGRPVLINFWATWCTPCREELPMIESAYRAHRDQGFTVVAIDYRESADAVRKFWSELELEPAPVLDPDGRITDSYGVGLSSTGLPVSVFLARDGSVSAWPAANIAAAKAIRPPTVRRRCEPGSTSSVHTTRPATTQDACSK